MAALVVAPPFEYGHEGALSIDTGWLENVCVICVEAIEGPIVCLACRCKESVFCGSCFQQYFDAQYRMCPLCKQPMDDMHAFPYLDRGESGPGRQANSRVSPSQVDATLDFEQAGSLNAAGSMGAAHSRNEESGVSANVAQLQEGADRGCFCIRVLLFKAWYYSFWGYWVLVNLLVYDRNRGNGLLEIVASLGNVVVEMLRLVFVGKWKVEPPCYVVRKSRCFRAHPSVVYLSGLMDMLVTGACLAISFQSGDWSQTLMMLLLGRLSYILMSCIFSACACE